MRGRRGGREGEEGRKGGGRCIVEAEYSEILVAQRPDMRSQVQDDSSGGRVQWLLQLNIPENSR